MIKNILASLAFPVAVATTVVLAPAAIASNISVGPSVGISNYSLSVGGTGVFQVTPKIDVAGTLDYSPIDKVFSVLSVSAHGHYNFQVGQKTKVYPLAGLSYHRLSVKSDYLGLNMGVGGVGLDIGGGLNYDLNKKLSILTEVKASIGTIRSANLKVGALFKL